MTNPVAMKFSLAQAVNLYRAAFMPPVVGTDSDGELFGETPSSTLARHLDLPFYLSNAKDLPPDHRIVAERQKVAAFLRAWADALETL